MGYGMVNVSVGQSENVERVECVMIGFVHFHGRCGI